MYFSSWTNPEVKKLFEKAQAENQPNIVIDEILFTFLHKFIDEDGRYKCRIISKKNDNMYLLTFYTSKSEGGFWRYAYSEDRYDKGYDYIVTTFCHFELQNFINNNLLTKNIVTLDTEINESVAYNLFRTFVNTPNREIKDDVFQVLQKCLSGYCFMDIAPIVRVFDEMNMYRLEENLQIFYNENANKFKEYLDQENFWTSMTKLKNIKTELKKIGSDERNSTEFQNIYFTTIQNLYNAISKYIEFYFMVISDKGKYISQFNNKTDNLIIDMAIYEIVIQNKITNAKYKLYYGIYDYKNINQPTKYDGKYKIILLITGADSKINICGVYDKVIYAGIYIYKIMEYMNRSTINNERRVTGIKPEDYIFIGDLMKNVWPLNIINNDQTISTIQKGSSDYYHKYLKYKNKYLLLSKLYQ